ncbi:aminodeoxychorismate/anthranilate synthase component II [bacterium]|jgi:anthranilate synthase component II|nr:aminodeoxychorismate/anthranilate synthase component II [bacterium]
MLLMIDNYDSFTYNLVQYFGELGQDPEVFRNDAITVDEIRAKNPSHIVISPGPGRPADAGITKDVIREFAGKTPILGVCLGHQAIGEVFGAKVTYAPSIMHGKTSMITHDGKGVFQGLESPIEVTRYHSLVLDPASLPDTLEVTSQTDDGIVMGVRHKELSVEGVQFHPESILTKLGKDMIKNFVT